MYKNGMSANVTKQKMTESTFDIWCNAINLLACCLFQIISQWISTLFQAFLLGMLIMVNFS